MDKSELGTKRICPTTGKKFYDLNKTPVISPYTGEVVTIAPIAPPRGRADAASRAAAAANANSNSADAADTVESEDLISLEDADAEENSGKKAVVLESEDDIEVDESLDDDDDSTFIADDDEENDDDVTDIIGDVSGDEDS